MIDLGGNNPRPSDSLGTRLQRLMHHGPDRLVQSLRSARELPHTILIAAALAVCPSCRSAQARTVEVVCTGGDDTSQIDRAIKDYNSSPNAATLSFSSGLCGITRPLVPILHGGVIHGDGGVTLVANFAVGNVMTISTEDQVAVRDIRIAAGPGIVRSSGAGLLITANPGKANANPHISSIVLDGMYVGVALERTVSAVVENSVFDNSRFAGLVKANLDSPDVGDDTISNCVFDSSDTAANSTAILQYAGGGLRIHDNKILRHAFGYRLSLAAGARTSDLIISANSFENQGKSAVTLSRTSGGSFANVVIFGNQIALVPMAIDADSDREDSHWIEGMAISGNILRASGPNAMRLGGADHVVISGNLIANDGNPHATALVGARRVAGDLAQRANTFAGFERDVAEH